MIYKENTMKQKILNGIILTLSFIEGVILMQIAFCFLHEIFKFEAGSGVLRLLGIRVMQENLALFWAVVTVLFCLFLSQIQYVEGFMVGAYGGEEMPEECMKKVKPAFARVCENAGVDPDDYLLVYSKNKDVNAYVVGGHFITVTAGLVEKLNEDEIAGILAHEMGHIQNKDHNVRLPSYFMTILGHWFLNICRYTVVITQFLIAFPFIGFLFILPTFALTFMIYFLHYFLDMPVNLVTFFGLRNSEYAADEYACKIGLGPELYNGLNTLGDITGCKEASHNAYSSHPSIKNRLERITAYVEAHK